MPAAKKSAPSTRKTSGTSRSGKTATAKASGKEKASRGGSAKTAGGGARRKSASAGQRAQTRNATTTAAARSLGRTLVYVHGPGNKPKPSVLKAQWDRALFGFDLGERSRMAYCVNRDRYPDMLVRRSTEHDAIPVPESAREGLSAGEQRALRSDRFLEEVDDDIEDLIDTGATGAAGATTVLRAAARFWLAEYVTAAGVLRAGASQRQAMLARYMVQAALPALYDYLYDARRRKAMQSALSVTLRSGVGPFVIVAHGVGALVVRDVLASSEGAHIDVRCLILLASPDTVPEVAHAAAERAADEGLSRAPTRTEVRYGASFDPLSGLNSGPPPKSTTDVNAPVNSASQASTKVVVKANTKTRAGIGAADGPRPASRQAVAVSNEWFMRHAPTAYFAYGPLREKIRENMDHTRLQRLGRVTLTRDLVRAIEDALGDERTEVLFELTQPEGATGVTIDDVRHATVRALTGLVLGDRVEDAWQSKSSLAKVFSALTAKERVAVEALEITPLKNYVGAWLTRGELYAAVSAAQMQVQPSGGIDADEADTVARKVKKTPALRTIYRAWRNGRKYALINRSTHTVQAFPAQAAYGARGRGIEWAILDSGVGRERNGKTEDHPHLAGIVAQRWDCTRTTDLTLIDPLSVPVSGGYDDYGHGTHVAGIIAGFSEVRVERGMEDRRDNADWRGSLALAHDNIGTFRGIATETRLHSYKVLDDSGTGSDAWIIKALDHIEAVNDRAGRLQIAGINLSLAGPFDADAFGCGHTPLCDALRRLWRQGVVVVIAAGNSGRATLLSDGDDADVPDRTEYNMTMTIEDPANLEDAIAVGSVHRVKPHTYGISHFSSRGPTADGRQKPDCVAPGEQIVSCRHDWIAAKRDATPAMHDHFVAMDGTSMAAPHVSGIIAAFLSMRREFIGQPDRVKEILLRCCTDLGRVRSMQGAGLPNLVKMLLET